MEHTGAKDPGEQEFIQAHYALAEAALRQEDPRDQELIQAHSALAKEVLRQHTAATRKIVEEHPRLSTPTTQKAITAETQYKYFAEARFFGILYTVVEVRFYDNNYNQIGLFRGPAGGLSAILGTTWGTAYLNYRYDEIVGWDARFEANFVPYVTNINWWGLHGETIGSFIGGGLAAGYGIVGGQGTFYRRG